MSVYLRIKERIAIQVGRDVINFAIPIRSWLTTALLSRARKQVASQSAGYSTIWTKRIQSKKLNGAVSLRTMSLQWGSCSTHKVVLVDAFAGWQLLAPLILELKVSERNVGAYVSWNTTAAMNSMDRMSRPAYLNLMLVRVHASIGMWPLV
jgi:hypothetical protein